MSGKTTRCLAILAAASVLPGCANVKDDASRTKTEGTMAGTAGGAIVGGLLGAATGAGSPIAIIKGAVSWGAAGGYWGHGYGSRVARRKSQYKSEEAYLDACIAEVNLEVKNTRKYNALARRWIADDRKQLDALIASGGASGPDGATLRQRLEAGEKNLSMSLKHWQQVIEDHKDVIEKTRDREKKEQLAAEARRLEAETAKLRSEEKELMAIKERLRK